VTRAAARARVTVRLAWLVVSNPARDQRSLAARRQRALHAGGCRE